MNRSRPPTPSERPTTLWVNGRALLTVQTTPQWLDDWAYGLLFSEGVIDGPEAVRHLEVDGAALAVYVEADLSPRFRLEMARRRYVTSGCGKGVTFSSVRDAMMLKPLEHPLAVDHAQLFKAQKALEEGAALYRATGGVHSAAVVDAGSGQALIREDIGRHNAVDKAVGAAMASGWNLERCFLVTSGRISYEMCVKLARARLAVGASRTAATDQAVRLADRLRIALVGYLRSERMVVYTDTAGRLKLSDTAETGAGSGPEGAEAAVRSTTTVGGTC
ncbi:MAG: formate dehydrogenase accessory sulfurtransferase FdhD [Firmicutes bacterium]|nr:formate dehydrogenase accessory sulfurtransferase FdhD [Bacillota bacterium]